MITAIVLIDCATDSIPEVAEALANLHGVSEVYSVAGNVDLIAIVRVREFDQIAEVIAGPHLQGAGRDQHRVPHRVPRLLPARPGGGVRDRPARRRLTDVTGTAANAGAPPGPPPDPTPARPRRRPAPPSPDTARETPPDPTPPDAARHRPAPPDATDRGHRQARRWPAPEGPATISCTMTSAVVRGGRFGDATRIGDSVLPPGAGDSVVPPGAGVPVPPGLAVPLALVCGTGMPNSWRVHQLVVCAPATSAARLRQLDHRLLGALRDLRLGGLDGLDVTGQLTGHPRLSNSAPLRLLSLSITSC